MLSASVAFRQNATRDGPGAPKRRASASRARNTASPASRAAACAPAAHAAETLQSGAPPQPPPRGACAPWWRRCPGRSSLRPHNHARRHLALHDSVHVRRLAHGKPIGKPVMIEARAAAEHLGARPPQARAGHRGPQSPRRPISRRRCTEAPRSGSSSSCVSANKNPFMSVRPRSSSPTPMRSDDTTTTCPPRGSSHPPAALRVTVGCGWRSLGGVRAPSLSSPRTPPRRAAPTWRRF